MSELHHLSATEVLARFRSRALSPVEILDAVNARADAVEPTVNALLERDFQDFRAQAKLAEERYARRGEVRPLEGLPVAIKEEQPIAGRPMRFGSLVTEGWVSQDTHPLPERVLAAGAIVHARTTTPEFSSAAFTHSALWGITRNPWNPEFTAGGSSGGSGAALAAGTAYLASGSDIGGSIRIPAALCGVVGFKPPHGRVPSAAPFNLDPYCHDGPMARTVADLALFQNVIAGQHPFDPVSLPALPIPDELGHVRGLRVGLAVTLGDYPVEREIEINTRAVGAALRAAGAVVEEVVVELTLAEVTSAALVHYGLILAPSLHDICAPDDARLMDYTRLLYEQSMREFEKVGSYNGIVIETKVYRALAEVFARFDALVCPTLGGTGFKAGDSYLDGLNIAGVKVDPCLFLSSLTPVFNIASRHPVLSLPSGRDSSGVPTGVQIVARPYDDITAFHVGAAAERELGLWSDQSWRPPI